MQNISRVNVFEATQNLIHKALVMRICQRLVRFDDLVHIALHQLFIEIDLIEIALDVGDKVEIVQACDIFMASEVFEQLDFSQSPLGQNLFAEYVCDFLNCNGSSIGRTRVFGGAHNAVRTVAQLFQQLEPLVDDKVLVEDAVSVRLGVEGL